MQKNSNLQTIKQSRSVKTDMVLCLDEKNTLNVGISFQMLRIFFSLIHIRKAELQSLIQFFQKYQIKFYRIKNKKEINVSQIFKKKANYVAESLHVLSFDEVREIVHFLNSKKFICGFIYGAQLWTFSRIQNRFLLKNLQKFDQIWTLFNQMNF
jgi:hypothetical protein